MQTKKEGGMKPAPGIYTTLIKLSDQYFNLYFFFCQHTIERLRKVLNFQIICIQTLLTCLLFVNTEPFLLNPETGL